MAMYRRIMVAIEFRQPDHLLRKAIWKSHVPEQMTLAGDTDLVNIVNSSSSDWHMILMMFSALDGSILLRLRITVL